MAEISVKDILEVHANVTAMQQKLTTQAEVIRRKDRDIELLRWKLRGAEEMCLLARFSEAAYQMLLESTELLNRSRISLGNHFLAFAHTSSQSSIDALRGDIKSYRDSIRGSDDRLASLSNANEGLERSVNEKTREISMLRARVSLLEKDVAAGQLSAYYEEEIASREALIVSLRSHNTQLLDVLRKPPPHNNTDRAEEPPQHEESVSATLGKGNVQQTYFARSVDSSVPSRDGSRSGRRSAHPVPAVQGAWSSARKA